MVQFKWLWVQHLFWKTSTFYDCFMNLCGVDKLLSFSLTVVLKKKTAEFDVIFVLHYFLIFWPGKLWKKTECLKIMTVFSWEIYVLLFIRQHLFSQTYFLKNHISASLIIASFLGIRIFLFLQIFFLWFSFTTCLSCLIGTAYLVSFSYFIFFF